MKQKKPGRNPFACDPLMKKCSVHQRSRKAQRGRDKQALKQAAYERPVHFLAA